MATTEAPEKNRAVVGVFWMFVTGICFVAVTALVKHGAQDLPAAEAGFLRYVIGLVFLLPLIGPIRAAKLTRRQLYLFGWRGLLQSLGVILWFYAMTRITVAEVTAGATTVRDIIGNSLDQLVLPVAVGRPFNTPEYGVPVFIVSNLESRLEVDEELSRIEDTIDTQIDDEIEQPGLAPTERFVDLANWASVLAIETEDLGRVDEHGRVHLVGRLPSSAPRGCSLSWEERV